MMPGVSIHEEVKGERLVYKVRWREGTRNRSRQFDIEEDAVLFHARQKRAKQTGDRSILAGEITLAEFATEWWRRHAEPNLAKRTLMVYGHQLDHRILPVLGHLSLASIRPAVVEEFSAELARRRVGRPTILKTLTVLQAIMRRAVIDGLVTVNPVREITKPHQARTREPILVPVDAVERMRHHLRDKGDLRSAALVCLLAYSGPRPESEALPLTWGRIRTRTILYTATKHRGRPERSVRLLAPLGDDLADWRAECSRTGPGNIVFPTLDGNGWREHDWRNWRKRTFLPAAKVAGLPADGAEKVRPRDLRSSFATLLVYEGQPPHRVAEQLGHSAATMLKDYARLYDDFDPSERIAAEDSIRRAREAVNR
jgi:integrase